MIVVIARALPRPDAHAAAEAALRAMLEPTRKEKGCLSYRCQRDVESNALVMIEEWDSLEALAAHFKTAHVKNLFATLPPLLAGPPDLKIHEVARTRDSL